MKKSPIRVLIVSPDADAGAAISRLFSGMSETHYELTDATEHESALRELDKGSYDVCLVDDQADVTESLDLIRQAQARGITAPVILITGETSHDENLAALDLGAADFLIRDDLTPALIEHSIRHALARTRNERELSESRRILQSTVDALPEQIALLDHTGKILAVNAAWTRAAASSGAVDMASLQVGANYLDVCERFSGESKDENSPIAPGIRDVISGLRREFVHEYTARRGDQQHWFILNATRLAGDGPTRVVVTHEDITQRNLAELKLLETTGELAEKNIELQAIFQAFPDMHLRLDCEGRILEYNAGLSSDEQSGSMDYVGRRYHEVFPRDVVEKFNHGLAEVVRSDKLVSVNYVIHTGNMRRNYEARFLPLLRTQIMVIIREITDLRRSEEAMRHQTRMLQCIVDSMADGVVVVEQTGQLVLLNPAAEHILGPGANDQQVFENRHTFGLFKPDKQTPFLLDDLPISRALRGEIVDAEIFMRDPRKPNPIWLSISARPLKDDTGVPKGAVAVFRDITHKKHSEEELLQYATFDSLTGLYNRRYLLTRLASAINASKRYRHPLSICMCDLDNFKLINDIYGHQTGDEVLRSFGMVIKEELRTPDIAGRYGGDEFCLVMPDTAAIHAQVCVERIRERFKKILFRTESGDDFSISATFGITELNDNDMSGEELVEAADQALYQAKKSGGNRVLSTSVTE